MYELIIKAQFAAAHRLRNYRGKCEHLHGHNWDVEVILTKGTLGKNGMMIDFNKAKRIIDRTLSRLDHKYLNSLKEFKRLNPTTECLAQIIAQALAKSFGPHGIRIVRVGVWESPYCGAYYYAM